MPLKSKTDNPVLNFIGHKPKNSDTLRYIYLFNHFYWDVVLYNDNKEIAVYKKCKPDSIESKVANRIFLRTSFEVDSALLFQTHVFRYNTEGSFSVKINGKEIANSVKPSRTKRFVWFDEEDDGYAYFSFPQKQAVVEIGIRNSNIENAVGGKFIVEVLSKKDEKEKSESFDKGTSILLIFFYFAIGIVTLALYYFHRESLENFYFALFCLSYSVSLVDNLFSFSSFIESLSVALSAYSLAFLVTYLSLILTEKTKVRKSLRSFSIIIGGLFILQAIFQYTPYYKIIWVVSIIYIVYYFVVGLILLLRGSNKKKWEVQYIKYGFFSALFFIFGIFVVLIILVIVIAQKSLTSGNLNVHFSGFVDSSRLIGLLIIPSTISIIIGKRNGLNQKAMQSQLTEIQNLSEENIRQEKEKQSILTEQNKVLEKMVHERTVDLQNEKKLVEEKNRAILDSIEYALRIQTAILPPLRIVKEYLNESFILYKPKDIVAGDFYWMEAAGSKVLFAACDCTGHGVSGAMISVLCNNALNRAVREYNLLEPAAILNKATEIIVENFSKSEDKIKDGMDVSICVYDTKTRILSWAGANNPLWIIKNNEVMELKGDKQSIGINEVYRPFTTHHIEITTEASVYIFSDGYADQFGGALGEIRLMRKRFKELLISIQHLPMQEQGRALDKFIEEFKGDEEQTDDILVIGVRI